jgi:hypothetical protein
MPDVIKNFLEVLDCYYCPVSGKRVFSAIARDPKDWLQAERDPSVLTGLGTIDFDKIMPEPKDLVQSYAPQYGSWSESVVRFQWRCDHWGIDSQAYYRNYSVVLDPQRSDSEIVFFTDRYSVPKLIAELSEQDVCEKYKLRYSWYGEDNFAVNAGTFVFYHGRIVEGVIPRDGTKEAYDLMFRLERKTPEELHFAWDEERETYVEFDPDE